MTPFATMRRALSDGNLLGKALGGDSWLAWRILLIAAMGEALTDEERPIFAKLTGREREPRERVAELWCVIGRRAGKSRAVAALLVYLATMVDYRAQLVSGERGVVLCLARTQEQAQVVLEYVATIAARSDRLVVFTREWERVKEGPHGGLSEAPLALMGSGLVELAHPEVEVGLEVLDRLVELLAEGAHPSNDSIRMLHQRTGPNS
jgi:hypothetical protein